MDLYIDSWTQSEREKVLRSLVLSCTRLKIETAYIEDHLESEKINGIAEDVFAEVELLRDNKSKEESGNVAQEESIVPVVSILQRLKILTLNLQIAALKMRDRSGIEVIAKFLREQVDWIDRDVKRVLEASEQNRGQG